MTYARTRIFLAAVTFSTAATPAAAQAPVTIAGVTAAPGATASGTLNIAARPGDQGTTVPFTVVNGKEAGPVLALVAGTHGMEYVPIVALQRMRTAIDPATLRGTVIMVHVANMPSYLGRTIYYSPVDGKNLNRVYPGDANGTVSQRIAHIITTQIIDRCDYLVDMHAGDGNESLRPYLYWNKLGVDAVVDERARQLALAWGADHIIIDTTRTKDVANSIYTQNTAHLRGKPAITTETGAMGLAESEMVQRNLDGALHVLRHLGMLAGAPTQTPAPVWLGKYAVLTSPETGTWHPAVERAHTVAKGAVIGRITDFFGAVIAEVKAPFDGEVMYVVGTPAMSKGEPVAMIATR